MRASYSPDDNKLRLYPDSRLPPDLYARVRKAGFAWAPKQELFVAPMWTPEREDLALELAGDIEDEDRTLLDRAEDRAERFEGYSEKRADEAERAREAVSKIADGIPLGQPLLVGHHSEKHARRDAKKIENGMRKAIKAFETSEYWVRRAKGALAHAKYKELPDVRARRIKGLEADERKQLKGKAHAEKMLAAWGKFSTPGFLKKKTGEESTPLERAIYLAQVDWWISTIDLREGKITPEAVQAEAIDRHQRALASCNRWLPHLANRLAYERAMLGESGYVPPPKRRSKAELPLLNYSGMVSYRDPYKFNSDQTCTEEATPITKAELAAIGSDYKGTRISSCGTHRVRCAAIREPGQAYAPLRIVYLTDSKQHPRPSAEATAEGEAKAEAARLAAAAKRADASRERALASEAKAPERAKAAPFQAMKESLKAGVKVAVVPQLFATPMPLAREAVALLGCTTAGMRILEPSAGTGNIVRAIIGSATGFDCGLRLTAVEINADLAVELRLMRQRWVYANESNFEVQQADFLECDFGPVFHGIVMNPPFKDAADIKHIEHALKFLKPGGKLVAICADGPRQNGVLKPLALSRGGTWKPLPREIFQDVASVKTVLLSIPG